MFYCYQDSIVVNDLQHGLDHLLQHTMDEKEEKMTIIYNGNISKFSSFMQNFNAGLRIKGLRSHIWPIEEYTLEEFNEKWESLELIGARLTYALHSEALVHILQFAKERTITSADNYEITLEPYGDPYSMIIALQSNIKGEKMEWEENLQTEIQHFQQKKNGGIYETMLSFTSRLKKLTDKYMELTDTYPDKEVNTMLTHALCNDKLDMAYNAWAAGKRWRGWWDTIKIDT